MSQPVASKNLYDLLGNDPELDPDREPEPPTNPVDKNQPRSGKRATGGDVVPKAAAKGEGAARRPKEFAGNERAIRDKTAGQSQNRLKPTEEGARQDRSRETNDRSDSGGGRGRGSRGGSSGYARGGMRGTRTARDDRHSRSGVGEHEKQAAHGWGESGAEGEFKDETGGLADARAEEKEGVIVDDTPVDENGVAVTELPAEPEDNTKSYEQYLAEQLEKKAALNDKPLQTRQANEGSSKKFPEGKAVERTEEEAFIAGSGGKKARTRERKEKSVLDIDQTWKESDAPAEGARGGRGGRGGRGRGEGGRGRGEGGRGRGEGGRGRGEGRGEGRGRGGPRGDRGDRGEGRGGGESRGGGEGRGSFRGDRGGARGGRGGAGGAPNLTDSSAFPSLGA